MKDSKTKVTERAGLDGWCRTALIVDTDSARSIDLVTPDGTLICRLNIHAQPQDEWANVDVIVNGKGGSTGRFLAWDNGRPVVDQELPGNTVFAVEVRGYAKAFRPERTKDRWVICIGAHGGNLFWSAERGDNGEWVHHAGMASAYRRREDALHAARCRIPREDRPYAWLCLSWGWPNEAEFLPPADHPLAVGSRTCANCHGKLSNKGDDQWCPVCSGSAVCRECGAPMWGFGDKPCEACGGSRLPDACIDRLEKEGRL